MPDVFVSYSRRDGSFVGRLVSDLESRGKSVWLDTEKIGDGEVFPEAIREAIEQSDSFVFVITPDSVESPYCESEVYYALELQKRIVPLLRAEVPEASLPEPIRVRNWIPFTEDAGREEASNRLVAALEADLEYTRAHTRYLVKALEWDASGRNAIHLLRGDDLAAAEQWAVAASAGADPEPTVLQREYILASRGGSSRRQRRIVAASVIVAMVSVALVAFALLSRGEAQTARRRAEGAATRLRSKDLAAESQTQLRADPERATLLAEAAVRADPQAAATFALQRALDVSPVLGHLASVGPQPNGGGYGADVAWRPNGTQIAETSERGFLRLINARTFRIEHRIRFSDSANAVAYNPAGTIVAVSGDSGTQLVDPDTGNILGSVAQMPNAYRLTFSPNGELLAATANGASAQGGYRRNTAVEIYDVRRQHLSVLHEGRLLRSAPYGLSSVSFSADSRRLVVGSSRGLGVFDVATGRLVAATDAHEATVAVFSPHAPTIAVAQEREIGLTTATLRLMTPDLHQLAIVPLPYTLGFSNALAYSPDGQTLAYGTTRGQLVLYSLARHEVVYRTQTPDEIEDLAFSPDGRKLVISHENGAGEILRATGAENSVFKAGSPIGRRQGSDGLAFGGGDLAVSTPVARGSGRVATAIWSPAGTRETRPVITPNEIEITTDGTEVVRLSSPPRITLRAWNLRSGRRIPDVALSAQHDMPFWWDYQGHKLLYTSDNAHGLPSGSLTVMSADTGDSSAFADSACAYYDAVFSQASGIAAAIDNCGHVGDTPIRAQRITLDMFPNHYEANAGLSLSPDGKYLAITNATDSNDVKIINTGTRRLVTTLGSETDVITDAEFSPNDQYVVTASEDRSARLWDARTGRLLRVYDHPAPVLRAIFNRSGDLIATLDAQGAVRTWPVCDGCTDPTALLREARARVTRQLTAAEKQAYLP